MAGLALGFILVGTADNDVAGELFHVLMEKTEAQLKDPNLRFIALGMALLFLGGLLFLLAYL